MEEVELADGRVVLVKELDPETAPVRPPFVCDPRRELAAYRSVLGPAEVDAPACVSIETPSGRAWLVLERLDGVPLWQIGELAAWEEAARWLARLHTRPVAAAAGLLAYDAAHLRRRFELAADLPRAASIGARVAERLAALPQQLIHGEFTPSNVLVERAGGRTRVRAVDWETCGVGPGVLDLAALTAGSWAEHDRRRVELAYAEACPPALRPEPDDVEYARLLLAAQWLGWSPGWTPPADHARDWRAEALASIARLGL
jgi:aminoglycoside/choline kinase family phosphotransferase